VFVVDVDGTEAWKALLARLGEEPLAPKVISGSREPHRFHLFFRHPDIVTGAKFTPWHPKLEFRGHAGLVVLPPSVHKSGRRYSWLDGQSIDDLPLPEVPALIAHELRQKYEIPRSPPRQSLPHAGGLASRLGGERVNSWRGAMRMRAAGIVGSFRPHVICTGAASPLMKPRS
jgi:hypothetical protein